MSEATLARSLGQGVSLITMPLPFRAPPSVNAYVIEGADGLTDRRAVERVEDDWLGAERLHGVGLRAGGTDDVMPALDELRDEAAADRAGRAGDEDA